MEGLQGVMLKKGNDQRGQKGVHMQGWVLLGVMLLVFSSLVNVAWAWEEGNVLNVHVVPHSHNDPGWWMTFEEYYIKWTKGILSSVVEILVEEPTRTFIWAEISYFQRWWVDQKEDVKNTVKRLVQNGQLEFVTAGWVMNDEANTHMIDIINQLTEGHEWLYTTLKTKPRFGWAIDPFGHSPTMPNVLQQMGFEGIVINRAHRELKEKFRNTKHLEFNWQGDNLNGSSSFNMLTHMLPWKLYDIPNTCGPEWAICATFDFERDGIAIPITTKNVEERSKTLVNMYKEKAKLFRHNSVLIPLGDDFKYKNPDMTRKIMTQYEMLFKYINSNKDLGVNIKFSTLNNYFTELAEYNHKGEANSKEGLPSYHGDFFTYCDEGEDYWSGYFTTRPFMKGLTRSTQAILRNGEILATLANLKDGDKKSELVRASFDSIETARRNVALFQHHDGVTGTARRQVVEDYSSRLLSSLAKVAKLSSDLALVVLSDKSNSPEELTWTTDSSTASRRLLEVTKSEGVIVIFNSLGHSRAEVVTVLVDSHNVAIVNGNGELVPAQVDPVWENGDKQPSSTRFLLHFLAEVHGIGLNTYFIKTSARHASLSSVVEYVPEPGTNDRINDDWNYDSKVLSEATELSIANSEYRVQLTGNGAVDKITRLVSSENSQQISAQVGQSFLSYSSNGGAYLFLPRGSAQNLQSNTLSVRVITGPMVSTVISVSDSSVKERTVRLFECYPAELSTQKHRLACPQSSGIEVLHTVDLKDSNTEIVTRFSTDIPTGGRFYTDSNGFDMRERQYVSTLPIQGNYYPITSSVFIESRSTKVRLTALSHQAHGATSLKEGELEIMLDRRLSADDGRGLGEPVMDNVRTMIPLWLVLESVPLSSLDSSTHPALSQVASDVWHARNYPLHTMHAPLQPPTSTLVHKYWEEHHQLEVAPLGNLPPQVQLLTLAPRRQADDETILRLYRPPLIEGLDNKLGVVNTEILFRDYSIVSLKENTLSLLHEKRSTSAGEFSIKSTEIFTWLVKLGEKTGKQNINKLEQENVKPEEDQTEDTVQHLGNLKDNKIAEEKSKPVFDDERKIDPDDVVDEPELIVTVPKQGQSNNDEDNLANRRESPTKDEPMVGHEPVEHEPMKGDGGEGRIGKVGEGQDVSFKIKEKSTAQASNTSALYATSIVFYLGLLVVVLIGGWLFGRRRRHGKDNRDRDSKDSKDSTRVPTIWKEREDSMMKLL